MLISHSYPTITASDKAAVKATLASKIIARGAKVAAFEKSVAIYLGLTGGVATSSGTSALFLALKSLKIDKDDEVILPSYVCPSVLLAVQNCGATPILCDTGEYWNIECTTVKAKVTSKTKAIIAPHIGGIPIDIAPIINLGIPVIEDLAQSFGAEINGRKAGTYGKLAICSFGAIKCLTTGEGGMVLSSDSRLLDAVRSSQLVCPMSDIQASLGVSQLEQYPAFLARRREIADLYFGAFGDLPGICIPDDLRHNSMFFRFPLRVAAPFEELKTKFESKGIAVRQFIDSLLHRQAGLCSSEFPNAEKCFKETLSLPIYPSLTNSQVKYIAKVGRRVLSKYIDLKRLNE